MQFCQNNLYPKSYSQLYFSQNSLKNFFDTEFNFRWFLRETLLKAERTRELSAFAQNN